MTDYLIDTNHVSVLLRRQQSNVSRRLNQLGPDDSFGIAIPILGELYFQVYASTRQAQNLAELNQFLTQVELWPYHEAEAQEYGRIMAEQKRKGRPIPAVDAQIAAVARVGNLTVLTADKHFSFVDKLIVENWLK